jgi:predicted DNA-binding transcriptional regulator AlpA
MEKKMKRLLHLLQEKNTTLEKGALLLSPKEVEKIFGFRADTLAQWRCQRKGPSFYKVGRSVKYRLPDIEEWLEANHFKCFC